MTKPINVEAQRIAKVISDTEWKLQTLSLLSFEFFTEIRKQQLSKEDLKSMFNNEAGKTLFLEAESEFQFSEKNIISNTMEPLDSEMFDDPETKLKARKHARDVKKQILKLVRIFSNKQMMDKLEKEIKVPRSSASSGNDIQQYLEVFRDLKRLWTNKLCTPLEEVQSIHEQLQRLTGSVKELEKTHRTKEESFSKYKETSREHMAQLDAEIKQLSELKTLRLSEQNQIQMNLKEKGEENAERKSESHKQRKVDLETRIANLENELKKVKETNKQDEEKLTTAFQAADRSYVDALQTYDNDMRQHEESLQMVGNALKEKQHERNQLKEEYEQREEEQRKYSEIQFIVEKKEKEHRDKMDALTRASQYVQAHWRGMLSRKEGEKARKKKKKGKGKKK